MREILGRHESLLYGMLSLRSLWDMQVKTWNRQLNIYLVLCWIFGIGIRLRSCQCASVSWSQKNGWEFIEVGGILNRGDISISEPGRSPPKAETGKSMGWRVTEGCDGRSANKRKGERVHFILLLQALSLIFAFLISFLKWKIQTNWLIIMSSNLQYSKTIES